MNIFDDEQSWHEAQTEYMERYVPMATPGDAHREWHLNSGVPMGQPGCPQDACHPVEDFDPDDFDMSTTHLWEYDNPVDLGMYDDDPNPYHGDMGYDDGIPF